MIIKEYIRPDGSNPYKKWFESLDSQAREKVSTARSRLEKSTTSAVKWFAGIGEYKIDWGPGYRIYLVKEADSLILLLGGGTKKTQSRDIWQARASHEEHKTQKKKRRLAHGTNS
jgi:putative addiction module killer protein